MDAVTPAGTLRAQGIRVPRHLGDERLVAFTDTIEDGEAVRRWTWDAEPEPDADRRERELHEALTAWGRAIRARYPICRAGPLDCGGSCRRIAGHEPPCSCSGNVPDDCPA